jgi:type IV secretory pathway VirB10-like protein
VKAIVTSNIARYLMGANLLNLNTGTEPPPAPPAATEPPAPVVPPATEPPPAPPAPPVPPAPEPTAEEKLAAIKTALKLPDGSPLPADALERTAAIASELGLSPAHAQRILDSVHQETAAVRQSVLDSLAFEGSEWKKQNSAQQAAALADPDLGAGSPEKLAAAQAKAQRGMAALFGDQTAAIETLITRAGFASSPTLVKAFMRVADRMGEPGFIPGTPSKSAGKRDADVLYPDAPAAPSA